MLEKKEETLCNTDGVLRGFLRRWSDASVTQRERALTAARGIDKELLVWH